LIENDLLPFFLNGLFKNCDFETFRNCENGRKDDHGYDVVGHSLPRVRTLIKINGRLEVSIFKNMVSTNLEINCLHCEPDVSIFKNRLRAMLIFKSKKD
jgi:hypothetical protein